MSNIKVSVICTSYNYAQYLPQALDSFLAQKTDFPFEIIVVDDCSTDGSREILTSYAERFPEVFRLFFNETNQGLTRTWIAICKEARGQYIARCDADDYWVDPYKLQKQVDLLDSLPESQWCNTDYNIVDEEGNLLHEQVFANGPVDYANTYAKMLATKGMTLPSSWMVDTALMQEVNQVIDPDSVDDGFPMQLEFFQKTKLSFLSDVTVAYRMTTNSDSRPKDLAKIEQRVNGLLKTQLAYLDKYPDRDLLDIARLQAQREAWQEIRAFHHADMIANRDRQISELEERLGNLEIDVQQAQKEVRHHVELLEATERQMASEREQLVDQYGQLLHQYNSVITSRRWTIPTRIINALPFRKGTSSEKENKMVVDKLLRTYREQGLRATVRKSKEHLHRLAAGGQDGQAAVHHKIDLTKIPVMPQWDDVIAADYLNQPYQKPARLAKEKLDIAWVSPPVGPGGGGHTTISRFVKFLQEQGHSVTFYIYNNNTMAQSAKEAQDIFRLSYGIDVAVADLDNFGDHDVVFATSWETAYPVFNLKKKNLHKFYFVQDFEPIFYGVGSRYMLAEATYKFGFYGITAGKWLTQKVSQYGMDADYFDFGADSEIYRPKGQVTKEKKIAFYARAHTERRGFELGIMALKIFKDRHPDYTIEFFGQDMSGYDIPFDFIDRGILNKEELAKIYHESVACLVLSLTNVSLLPLELLVAGCVPVMNTGDNNSMVLGDLEDIAYAEAYPTALADQLCRAVERDDVNAYAQAMSDKYHTLSWEESYRKVEHIIKREVCDGN